MYAQRTTGMQVGLQVLEKNGQPIRQLPLGQVRSFALSPDGTSLAVHAHDSNAASGELWIVDVARGTLLRIDNGSAHDDYPVWSPDGTRLAVSSGGLAIVTVGANSAREQLISQLEPLQPSDWSSDGKWLIYQSQADPDRGFDIWAMPMSGDRKPQAVVNTGQDERGGVLSPNGQWLAYTSGESGRPEIYLQPFPPDGRKIPVSASGGSNARWGSDGVLYYWSIEGAIMRAELDKLGSSLRLTAARPVFKTQSISTTFTSQANRAPYDVLPADRGYVSVYTPPTQMESPLMILLNWRTLYGSAKP
jgi:Tol biopolymer transport system component